MQLNKTPKPKGFNKRKLYIIFAIVMGIFAIVLIWVVTSNPVENKNTNASISSENYARNDPTGDVRDIVGDGTNQLTQDSRVTTEKANASSPQSQNAAVNQQAVQELRIAMKSPIGSNQISVQSVGSSSAAIDNQNSSTLANQDSGISKEDQSMTLEKRNFLKMHSNLSDNVLSTSLSNPVAPLVLSMGTKIPAQLDQAINSELPGQIYGHVSRDVFDSRTHINLLIPAGANLVGTYDSAIAYGQERLLVAWKRVNFPNGQWLDIQGMGGADPLGAGFSDQVNNHYWRIFGTTALISVLAAGAQLSQPQQSNALQSPGIGQTIGQSVGTQIANTGTMLLQKNINIQPTIHIRSGFEFTVEVSKDIVFPNAYTGNLNKN